MTEIFRYCQTGGHSPLSCELEIHCKEVLNVEDERKNRLSFIYEKEKNILHILTNNFDTLKIEYIPNE